MLSRDAIYRRRRNPHSSKSERFCLLRAKREESSTAEVDGRGMGEGGGEVRIMVGGEGEGGREVGIVEGGGEGGVIEGGERGIVEEGDGEGGEVVGRVGEGGGEVRVEGGEEEGEMGEWEEGGMGEGKRGVLPVAITNLRLPWGKESMLLSVNFFPLL